MLTALLAGSDGDQWPVSSSMMDLNVAKIATSTHCRHQRIIWILIVTVQCVCGCLRCCDRWRVDHSGPRLALVLEGLV